MKEYAITITETLALTMEIDANSYEEAVEKVRDMYYEEEIILDSLDLVNCTIE